MKLNYHPEYSWNYALRTLNCTCIRSINEINFKKVDSFFNYLYLTCMVYNPEYMLLANSLWCSNHVYNHHGDNLVLVDMLTCCCMLCWVNLHCILYTSLLFFCIKSTIFKLSCFHFHRTMVFLPFLFLNTVIYTWYFLWQSK